HGIAADAEVVGELARRRQADARRNLPVENVGAQAVVELAVERQRRAAVETDHVERQTTCTRHQVVPPDCPELDLYRGLKRRQLGPKIKRLPVTTFHPEISRNE